MGFFKRRPSQEQFLEQWRAGADRNIALLNSRMQSTHDALRVEAEEARPALNAFYGPNDFDRVLAEVAEARPQVAQIDDPEFRETLLLAAWGRMEPEEKSMIRGFLDAEDRFGDNWYVLFDFLRTVHEGALGRPADEVPNSQLLVLWDSFDERTKTKAEVLLYAAKPSPSVVVEEI